MTREYDEYERAQEWKTIVQAMAANLAAILTLHEVATIASLARQVYTDTSCGATLGALLYAGEDNPGHWLYGNSLQKLTMNDLVCALSISSIVEGSEQTTQTYIIDLMDKSFQAPIDAATAFAAALTKVEEDARLLGTQLPR